VRTAVLGVAFGASFNLAKLIRKIVR